MRRSPRPARSISGVSASLDRQLTAYAIAATGAGVCLLSFPRASEAKIIFTKADQVVAKNGIYGLDLNNDGIVDFLIHEWPFNSFTYGSSFSNRLGVRGAIGNPVIGRKYYASALNSGAQIGPAEHFTNQNSSLGLLMAAVATDSDFGTSTISGDWANVKNRYLGLRFKINGKDHFGWARLSVTAEIRGFSITATLTGYAYETVAGKEILAGQKTEEARPVALSGSARHSLGSLAKGTTSARRRKP